MPFELIHADDHLLVLNKPSGLLSVPGRGPDKQDCLSARVQAQYPDALIVHRLDMDTSGLLIMARCPAMQRQLSMAFAARQVNKRYIAVVAGHLPPPDTPDGWGLIDLPIQIDWPNRPLRVIDPVHGKPSQTRWRVAKHTPGHAIAHTTRVELDPLTGRSHQLRIHLQALGHPILGDPLYAPPAVLTQAGRLLLHASHLAFPHPATGQALSFNCPPPF